MIVSTYVSRFLEENDGRILSVWIENDEVSNMSRLERCGSYHRRLSCCWTPTVHRDPGQSTFLGTKLSANKYPTVAN